MEERDPEKLWNSYDRLASYLIPIKPEVEQMLLELGERIVECSSSVDTKGKGCGIGGLIETSIAITTKMRTLAKMFNIDVSQESIITVGLFHALGMIGDRKTSYLVDQTSSWHREKGMLYTYNEECSRAPVPHRSLRLLQEFGVKLTSDEWTAIAISHGAHREENRAYVGFEPKLAILVTQARQWVFGRDI